MKNIDFKLVIIAILLLGLIIIAYYYWQYFLNPILDFIKSPLTTVVIWGIMVIIAVIHYFNNKNDEPNSINDKEGLEGIMDYLQFIGTYATLLTSAQTIGKDFFIQWNFPNQSCNNFGQFDKICLISCVFILIGYSVTKIKPILSEAFKKRQPITNITDVQ